MTPAVRARIAAVVAEVGSVPFPSHARQSVETVLRYYESIQGVVREVGPIAVPGPEVKSSEVVAYFERARDAAVYGAVPAMQCKLVLLGDVAAGKTSLLRALRTGVAAPTGDRRPDGTAPDATQGADVYCWRPEDALRAGTVCGPYEVVRANGDDRYVVCPLAGGGAAEATLERDQLLPFLPAAAAAAATPGGGDVSSLAIHAYDMGGHEAYRASQQMYLAGECLFMIVFDASLPGGLPPEGIAARASACARSVAQWARALCARYPTARVVLVGTHGDACAAPEAVRARVFTHGWRGTNTFVGPLTRDDIAIVSSVGDLAGVEGLRRRVVDGVMDVRAFPGVRAQVPRVYLRLQAAARRLRRAGRSLMAPADFLRECGPLSVSLPGVFSRRACAAGACCSTRGCPAGGDFGVVTHTHSHCARCGSCTGSSCLRSVPTADGRGSIDACAPCERNDPSTRALAWLHDVGAIVHFAEDAVLMDHIALSPQFLIDAMRRLVGDAGLMSLAGHAVAATGTSYLVDGILRREKLEEAWAPLVRGDTALVLVLYEMMRKMDLFVPLDEAAESRESGLSALPPDAPLETRKRAVELAWIPLHAVPEQTLVPCMLDTEESTASKTFWSAAWGARGTCVLWRRFGLSVGGGAPFTPYGLLHRLMVRVGRASVLASSVYWSSGWSGEYRVGAVRARIALEHDDSGEYVSLRVAGALERLHGLGALLSKIRSQASGLLSEWHGGSPVEFARCPCARGCEVWARVDDIELARALAPTMKCTLCGGEVPLQLVEPGPEVTAADLADSRALFEALRDHLRELEERLRLVGGGGGGGGGGSGGSCSFDPPVPPDSGM